jgi:hypothetical protein
MSVLTNGRSGKEPLFACRGVAAIMVRLPLLRSDHLGSSSEVAQRCGIVGAREHLQSAVKDDDLHVERPGVAPDQLRQANGTAAPLLAQVLKGVAQHSGHNMRLNLKIMLRLLDRGDLKLSATPGDEPA